MPANTSGYSRSQPSGSSSIRQGDDMLRSDKSILEETLNEEHYFAPQDSASSASGGLHRTGSARIHGGTRSSMSTPSSVDSSHRLYYATNTETLHFWGASSATTIADTSKGNARIYTGTRSALVTPSSALSDGRLFYATDLGSLHYLGASSATTISSGASPFRAHLERTAVLAVPSLSTVTWQTIVDISGLTCSVGASRITVQTGAEGRYLIVASSFILDDEGGTVRLAIAKNGRRIAQATDGGRSESVYHNVTSVQTAANGDFFEYVLDNSFPSGSTVTLMSSNSGTYFTITRLH